MKAAWLLPPLLLLLAACAPQPQVHNDRFHAFGTVVDVSIYTADDARAKTGFAQVREWFEKLNHDWHAWQSGALNDLNLAISEGRSSQPHPSLLPLIRRSAELSARSDGLFNPAVGKLVRLWSFHSDLPGRERLPDPDKLRALLAQPPRMTDVSIDGATVTSANPTVSLDFGGFAKGVAVDGAIERLRALGLDNAIVNTGGDLRAVGDKGGQPWRIGIRHPRRDGVLAAVETHGDEAVFSSGDYERYFELDGRRYHHIIDPRSGYPAEGASAVTVITRGDAALADAAATALMVAGTKDWPRIARQMGIEHVLLVATDGSVWLTPAMAERVSFLDPQPRTVQVDPSPAAQP